LEVATLILTVLSLIVGATAAVAAIAYEQLSLAQEVRLELLQEQALEADNEARVGRFVLHNIGTPAINIDDILVDTWASRMGAKRPGNRGVTAEGMGREEGAELPGWLQPEGHIRLYAYNGARTLRNQGFVGQVETDLIVVDSMGTERRYPITLFIRGDHED